MPTYHYERRDNGELVALVMTIEEMNRRERNWQIQLDDGTWADRVFPSAAPLAASPRAWPKESFALGVPARHRQVYADHYAARGVPTEFKRDGTAILTSRAHRKALCKLRGLHDNTGGYGDA